MIAAGSPNIMLKWSPGNRCNSTLCPMNRAQPKSSSLGGVRPETSARASRLSGAKNCTGIEKRAWAVTLQHAHVGFANFDQRYG